MTAARKPNLVSVDDYLEGEFVSPIKHEYLDGVVIESTSPRVVVHRRSADGDGAFDAEVYEGLDAVIELADAGVSLRLAELYDRIDFKAAQSAEAPEELQ